MTKNNDSEKLRIIGTIKENASTVLAIGGFCWIMFQFIFIPLVQMQDSIKNILDNHLATIQSELTEAKTERNAQGKQLIALSEQIVRLTTQLEK